MCQDRPRDPRGFARAKTHPERNFTFVVWINTAVLILSGGESARAERDTLQKQLTAAKRDTKSSESREQMEGLHEAAREARAAADAAQERASRAGREGREVRR